MQRPRGAGPLEDRLPNSGFGEVLYPDRAPEFQVSLQIQIQEELPGLSEIAVVVGCDSLEVQILVVAAVPDVLGSRAFLEAEEIGEERYYVGELPRRFGACERADRVETAAFELGDCRLQAIEVDLLATTDLFDQDGGVKTRLAQ